MMKRPHVLALAAAAFAGFAPRDANAQTGWHINVGTMPADFGGQAFYANDLNMFTKAGFADAAITSMNGGAAIATATLAGSLDVGYSNVVTLAIAHDKGIPVVLLAAANVYDEHSPTVGLLSVKRSSPIKTASDLSGKTIGVNAIANMAFIGMRNWIDKNGGDSTKVQFVELSDLTMAAAILAGRIDGGNMNIGNYPTLGRADDPIRVLANTYSSIGPRFITGAYFSTRDWVAKNPAAAKAFAGVMREAGTWANGHNAESAAILAKYLKESSAAIEAAPRVVFATTLNAQLLQPPIDVAAKYGLIKTAFSVKDIISTIGG